MASIDFTEKFDVITDSPATGVWTEIDLTSLGVPDNAVVCVLMEHKIDNTHAVCGVRKVGSSLIRYAVLHEPENGGSTSIVMHVQSDATASIEYIAGNGSTVFTLLGYYGAGITYTEEITSLLPTVAGWRETAVGQNDTVFEFSCQNIGGDTNTAENVGTRAVGSGLARYQDIHEAEPHGVNTYTSYVQSDGSGNVELHRADAYGKFYRLGYFSSNIQLVERFDLCTPASDATWGEQSIVAGGANCVGLICCMHQSNNTEENTGARGGASSAARYWLEHESETDQYTGDTLPVLIDASGNYDTYFGDVSDGYFHCLGYLWQNQSPTTILDTADKTDFGADTTPTLEFTATDVEDEDVTYEIQISSLSSFSDPVDSYYEVPATYYMLYSGSLIGVAQSFTGNGGSLLSCQFYLAKCGSPTGDIVARIYNIKDNYGSNSEPDGVPLATSESVDISTLSIDPEAVRFIFTEANQIIMGDGSYYAITVEYSSGNSGNYLEVYYDGNSPTHDGNLSYKQISAWYAQPIKDALFSVHSILEKYSDTDTGFTNTTDGGDSDPFDSPDKCDYTVQAGEELGDNTYYWRVRAKDPLGSELWGDWAATREFYIGEAGGVAPTSVFFGPFIGPFGGMI